MICQQTVVMAILPYILPLPSKNCHSLSGLLYSSCIGYFYVAPVPAGLTHFFCTAKKLNYLTATYKFCKTILNNQPLPFYCCAAAIV